MNDALTVTIELSDGKYASINRIQRSPRDPRKSDIYKTVYTAVLEATTVERDRLGWTKAECECFTLIMRVMPARWRADASNIGKPECDALTEAEIWTDDRLANPFMPWTRYDDEGPPRVTIVVVKLYEPANVRVVDRLTKPRAATDRLPSISSSKNAAVKWDGGDIPEGYAIVNGYLEPAGPILEQIRKRA